jgi:hypothetical protein
VARLSRTAGAAVALAALVALLPGGAGASGAVPDGAGAAAPRAGGAGAVADEVPLVRDTVETTEVERVDAPDPKLPTLRFLDENRDFFRARLDRLRVTIGLRQGEARPLDARFLAYRDMLRAIGDAGDTTLAGEGRLRDAELLDRVGDLATLEETMDTMERLLAEQRARLAALEQDFVGRQRTALVILATGVPVGGAPRALLVEDPQGDDWRLELDAGDREALARGGTVELAHRLVEPRAHRWTVRFEDGTGGAAAPWEVALEPARDRLTFLELDLAGLDPAGAGELPARLWTR